jgi:hypothetical protein
VSLLLPSRKLSIPPWVRNDLWRRARAVPAVDFPFAATRSLIDIAGGRLAAFSRSGGQTITNSSGILEIAASGAAAFEHDPLTGECLGVLPEDGRSNLLRQSEDFSTTWTNTGSSENVNAAIAPDGNLAADALVDTAVSSPHAFDQSVTGLAGSTTYTLSCFFSKGARDFGFLALSPNASWGSGGGATAFFNLVNGTVTASAGSTGLLLLYPNGRYRGFLTATTTATPGTVTVRVGASTGLSQTYLGNGTEAVYVWGADMGLGSSIGSYVPSGTTSGSRNATLLDLVDAALASGLRTLFVEFRSPAVGTRGAFSLNDNSSSERAELITNGTDPRFVVVDGGLEQANINGGTVSSFTRTRVAVRLQANGFACSINGGAVSTDATGTLPTVDRLMLGRTQAGEYLNAPLARFTGWTQELSDTVLQELAR